MSKKVTIDPLTRIEGHLKFETTLNNSGVVTDAKCTADMYRGIEKALIGYDAKVAQQVTQRVCGVCPYAHAEASALALENAMGLKLNKNGYLLRNLIVGAYRLQDYLLHFYTLSALDFIDITAITKYQGKDSGLLALKDWVNKELKSGKIFPAAPFLPRYEAAYTTNQNLNISAVKHYLESIQAMAEIHKMVAIFGGKSPHPVAIEAGGVTTRPTVDALMKYETLLKRTKAFIKDAYVPDVKAVAKAYKEYFKIGKGTGDLLNFDFMPDENGENFLFIGGSTINGKFEALKDTKILESQKYSYYKDGKKDYAPMEQDSEHPLSWYEYEREQKKSNGKYSWSKAPRYRDKVVEVGAVAQVVNTYKSGHNPELNRLVDSINTELGIKLSDYNSVMGRHLCRAIVSLIVVDRLEKDLNKVVPGELGFIEKEVPKNASGFGFTEASRGALAHWIETDDEGLIKNYEMIVPTTWNISPKDSKDRAGAVEQMLIGTKVADANNPIELARIVRSADPCIACSVH
ncbi:nickel-dependent hydrogenase large subunit [Sulfurospirillum sp. 1612]|uniref:nickel-dependent hydrogenase large subunit n=1 Tax=Sulfurospirillum sp. 1612 TaxID=3094835 RepID=UPI002F93BDB9